MRRLIGILASVLALAACQKPLFNNTPRWMRMQDRYAHIPFQEEEEADSLVTPVPDGHSVYAAAVRFPDGVDWREGDYRQAELVLLRDSVEVRSFPFSGDPAPDRIRLLGTQIWTDETRNGRATVIRCNGEEKLSWSGEEVIQGLLVTGGHIHTLGQRAGGRGICYRVDGEVVFESPLGTILGGLENREWPGGALSADSLGVYYTYCIPVKKGKETLQEYHVMRGDEQVQLVAAGMAHKVFDVRPLGGVIYRSECRSVYSWSLCLVQANAPISMGISPEEEVLQAQLITYNGYMLMKGLSKNQGNPTYTYWVRDMYDVRFVARSNFLPADIYLDQGWCAYITLDQGRVCQAYKNGDFLPVRPDSYVLKSSRCAAFRKGIFAMALTHASGDDHLLTADKEAFPHRFNGYFVAIQIQ